MPHRLPAAAVLLFYTPALAGPPAAPGANASPPNPAPQYAAAEHRTAGALLDEARARLGRYRTVSAMLRQTARVGTHRFASRGAFLRTADGRVRLELNPVPADEATGEAPVGPSVLQVCDGAVMHTRVTIGDRVAVTRRNVRTVREAAAARGPGATLAADLASGGLNGLLASLRAAADWDEPRAKSVGGRRFVELTGRWNAANRAAIDAADTPLKPDGVTVFLDAERLFPHRVRYWTRAGGPAGNARTPVLTLDLSDVTVNGPVPPDAFAFVLPDGVEVDDLTDRAAARAAAAALPTDPPPAPAPSPGPTP